MGHYDSCDPNYDHSQDKGRFPAPAEDPFSEKNRYKRAKEIIKKAQEGAEIVFNDKECTISIIEKKTINYKI